MLITIWGKAGSGKWTVSKLLAKKLDYKIISIGDMKRKLAEEMGINIIEFNKIGDDPKKSAEFDLKYEEHQKNLSLDSKIILDSRLGFYAQPKAFKILLDVDEEIAGERIFNAKRSTDKNTTKEQAITEVKNRNSSDEARFMKLYNIDLWNPKHYNLVIDTSDRTPEQVLDIIINEYKNYKLKKWIAETDEEKKLLRKMNRKKKLIKDITLLVTLILITFWRLFTIMNEQKKLENKQNIDKVDEIIANIE